MAAPIYTVDLVDINLAEATTNWTKVGNLTGNIGANIDYAIQGINAIDGLIPSGSAAGMMADFGSQITMGADDHIFAWISMATPGLADSLANGGVQLIAGTSLADYQAYYLNGFDTLPAGGILNYAVKYGNVGAPSPGATVGTPGVNPQFFGGMSLATAAAKGTNFAVDAVRYGTGAYITGGDATTPGSFKGFTVENDLNANRWGVLCDSNGTNCLKGKFVIGQNASKVPTAAYFVADHGVLIITDTPHSTTDFTQIIVDHETTYFEMEEYLIQSSGVNNPGKLVFNNDLTIGMIDKCVFVDFGETILRAGVTVTGCGFRDCFFITQNGATFQGSHFDHIDSSRSILSDNPENISDCSFKKGVTGHGVEITIPGTYDFIRNDFFEYAAIDGDTGDEMIYNNSNGLVTINRYDGTPLTVRNSPGSTTVVNNLTLNPFIAGGVRDSDMTLQLTAEFN